MNNIEGVILAIMNTLEKQRGFAEMNKGEKS